MNKKIYLGADHAGFYLKDKLKQWLSKEQIAHQDLGNIIYDSKDDYPDFAEKVAVKVVEEKTLGILVCGSAQGVCIAANKIKGARAVIPFSLKETRLAREHNDANILCLSGWYTHLHWAKKMIKIFLSTEFSKEARHVRRVYKIRKLEAKR